MLLRHWFCAGHAWSVARPGDYVVVELGSESVIIVRERDGQIRALLNVCRHRGSRICTDARAGRAPAGSPAPITRGAYDLDGRLARRAARCPNPSTEAGCASDTCRSGSRGADFHDFRRAAARFRAGGEAALAGTRARPRLGQGEGRAPRDVLDQSQLEAGVENYMECYHCQPAHPEFSERHIYARPAEADPGTRTAGRRRAEALASSSRTSTSTGAPPRPGRGVRLGLSQRAQRWRRQRDAGRQAHRPSDGRVHAHDGNSTYFDIGPLQRLSRLCGLRRHLPLRPRPFGTPNGGHLARARGCSRGQDYDVDPDLAVGVTSAEDKKIVELNQAGVNSRFFGPGPYSLQEPHPRRLSQWYLAELGR